MFIQVITFVEEVAQEVASEGVGLVEKKYFVVNDQDSDQAGNHWFAVAVQVTMAAPAVDLAPVPAPAPVVAPAASSSTSTHHWSELMTPVRLEALTGHVASPESSASDDDDEFPPESYLTPTGCRLFRPRFSV